MTCSVEASIPAVPAANNSLIFFQASKYASTAVQTESKLTFLVIIWGGSCTPSGAFVGLIGMIQESVLREGSATVRWGGTTVGGLEIEKKWRVAPSDGEVTTPQGRLW